MAMMAMTTRSSMRVKPRQRRSIRSIGMKHPGEKDETLGPQDEPPQPSNKPMSEGNLVLLREDQDISAAGVKVVVAIVLCAKIRHSFSMYHSRDSPSRKKSSHFFHFFPNLHGP